MHHILINSIILSMYIYIYVHIICMAQNENYIQLPTDNVRSETVTIYG